jgi:antitoxin MazE
MFHLTHIGNSFGVRIPKAILTQLGFKESTNLEFKVTQEGLLISPVRPSRKGWVETFQEEEKGQPEPLLMGENIVNKFDQEDWEW